MPTVLPSVEKGLLGRGRWDKPLPAGGGELVNGGVNHGAGEGQRRRS